MAQTVADLDFDPIALLEQELGSNDRSARLRAVKGLPALATACGVEVTRTKILSILAEHVRQEEEDEVQYRIAMLLGDFSALLGGDQHGALLFDLLQSLARIEETMVRAKAVASLSSVFASVDVSSGGAEVGASAVKIVSGMADPGADATGFGAKVSAASVCAAAAALLERCGVDEAVKKELRDVYARICADDAPIVRRAAAHELAAMCEAVAGAEAFDGDLSATAMKLIGDEHDAVRLIAVEQLGRVLGSERCAAAAAKWASGARARLADDARAAAAAGDGDDAEPAEEPWYAYEPGVHVVATAHVDASWRVRESLAKSFAGYVAYARRSVPDDGVGGCSKLDLGLGLLSMFAALFDDAEVEVRVAAHKSTNDVAATWSACFARHGDCVEAAGRGADAPELKVRMAAACALTKLLATLTPLQAPGAAGPPPPADAAELAKAQRALFDVVEAKLFADEHVDVLLATLRELAVAVPLLEGDSAARVAALVESTAHDNWRVRAALNGALPAVALARGKDAFEAQLLEGFVRSFQDRISEVRTSAVAVLGELRALKKPDGATGLPTDEALFDGDWLMEKIGKRLSELYLTMSYYLYRITIVAAFERLAHGDVAAEHMETIVLFLVDGARDDVPNVRFTAVKALETVSLHANDRLVANFIKPVLNELLANDTDADVRNYVKGAIAAL